MNSIINSTTGKYCSVAFVHLNGHAVGLHPAQTQSLGSPCTDNKQYRRKVLLNSFHHSNDEDFIHRLKRQGHLIQHNS